MALKLIAGLRLCCLAAAFVVANAHAAEPRSPLIGLTQDQLLERYGVPKSQIAAGGRVVMFFARERVVLRNGTVVEVELLPADLPPRPAPPPPAKAAPADGVAVADSTPSATNAPVAPPADATIAPPPQDQPAPALAAPAEPQLAIKLVRPPTPGGAPRPAPKQDSPAVPPVVEPVTPRLAAATPMENDRPATPSSTVTPAPRAAESLGAAATAKSSPVVAGGTSPGTPLSDSPTAPVAALPSPAEAAGDSRAADKVDEPLRESPQDQKEKAQAAAERRLLSEPDFPDAEESIFTLRTYLIGFLVIGSGVGFLLWQRNQRQLALAATAVSRTPFSPLPTSSGGAMFPANLLGELEWKRFEELVESYYSKTGVVAVRTKSGPQSPVHIKISWKGEPRPFACVQCIAHPTGLIDAKPIQDLFAVLTAEDIRRGYVVTTGKFNVAARDFAEEKHITLMSGDIFVEKLNALPASARAELIQEFSVGDYATPTCPKCDAKMVRGTDDPTVWQCKTDPDATIPAWK